MLLIFRIQAKVDTKVFTYYIVHSYKEAHCDLCKKQLPEKIRYKGKVIELFYLKRPETNYLTLEALTFNKSSSNFLFFVNLKPGVCLRVGRANDSDLRFIDITISRSHAEIRLKGGSVYLKDIDSKFGTLARIPSTIKIIPNKEIYLQTGRCVLHCRMKKTLYSFLTCYK